MCVCVCVCMHVCMCMCKCTCDCLHVCMCECICVCSSPSQSLISSFLFPSRLLESSWCTSSSGESVSTRWGTVWGSTLAEHASARRFLCWKVSIAVVIFEHAIFEHSVPGCILHWRGEEFLSDILPLAAHHMHCCGSGAGILTGGLGLAVCARLDLVRMWKYHIHMLQKSG